MSKGSCLSLNLAVNSFHYKHYLKKNPNPIIMMTWGIIHVLTSLNTFPKQTPLI